MGARVVLLGSRVEVEVLMSQACSWCHVDAKYINKISNHQKINS